MLFESLLDNFWHHSTQNTFISAFPFIDFFDFKYIKYIALGNSRIDEVTHFFIILTICIYSLILSFVNLCSDPLKFFY